MTLTKYEIYVKALLDGREVLAEGRHAGKTHLSDELMDFERAVELAELTPKQATVFNLRYTKHMEQSDIAKCLGVEQSTSSRHLHAAVKKIANIYEEWEALEYVN